MGWFTDMVRFTDMNWFTAMVWFTDIIGLHLIFGNLICELVSKTCSAFFALISYSDQKVESCCAKLYENFAKFW